MRPLEHASLSRIATALERLQGPRCPDDVCPDHDGEHPYHENALVKAHEAGQAKVRALLERERLRSAALLATLATVQSLTDVFEPGAGDDFEAIHTVVTKALAGWSAP